MDFGSFMKLNQASILAHQQVLAIIKPVAKDYHSNEKPML